MRHYAMALVRMWTWVYTSGMPADLRDSRRAEIESDLWEDTQLGDDRPAAAFFILVRLLGGVPDDLLWRAELMDLRTKRRRTGVWLTTMTVALISGLWVRAAMRPPELPQLPRSPITTSAWLMRPVPPPPPPPPPPRRR